MKDVLLVACCIFLTVVVTSANYNDDDDDIEYKDYTGHQVIRATPLSLTHTSVLQELHDEDKDGVEFWLEPGEDRPNVDIHVTPDHQEHIKKLLDKSSIPYDTITSNLQTLIDEQKTTIRNTRSLDEGMEDHMNHSYYRSWQQIANFTENIQENCSKCRIINIGSSTEGRDLKVIQIGEANSSKPAVFIDAGIHAREWIAPATALYIISKLSKPTRISDYLTNQFTWYILPLANPDGYAFTWDHDRMWRKTRSVNPGNSCRGVDPNRNWSFHWDGPGNSRYPCSQNYRGQDPFSEPETQAMANFLNGIRNRLVAYLSLHSYGQYWLTPWGYTHNLPSNYPDMLAVGSQAVAAIRGVNGAEFDLGSSSRLLYLAAGGSDDWVKGILGVDYAYTVELRDTGRYGFLLPPTYIEDVGREMLYGVRAFALEVQRRRRRRVIFHRMSGGRR